MTGRMIHGLGVGCAAGLLGLVGCASVPDKSELTRLDAQALESAIVGNTVTKRADYGRWAEYWKTADSGVARAWGSWGSASASAEYDIVDGGEACAVYAGEPDWATPEHEYCWAMYSDADGNYYVETTKNTRTPEREGQMSKAEIRPGNAFGLDD